MGFAPLPKECVRNRYEGEAPVDHDVVHQEVAGAVGGDADPDRHQKRRRAGDVDADRQEHDRRGGEHDGEEVVRLEHVPGRLVVTPVPSHREPVHHEPVDQCGDRFHQYEHRHSDQHDGHDGVPLAGSLGRDDTVTVAAVAPATSRWFGAAVSHNSIARVKSAKPKR